MLRHPAGIVLALLLALPASAEPSARMLYLDALAKEQAVRVALNDPQTSPAALKAVKAVVGSYELVVRRYPGSSYSDDALWHAGIISLEASRRFDEPSMKSEGLRLLRALQNEYPTSRWARQVPSTLARISPEPSTPAALPVSESRPPTVKSTSRLATIKDIQRSVVPDGVRVAIELDMEVPFHEERIAGPARIFVDFSTTRAAAGLIDQTLRFDRDGDIVRQVRIGRHPNSTTRIVLDADGVSSYSVYPLYSPYRLVIECLRTRVATSAPLRSAGFASFGPLTQVSPDRELLKPLATTRRVASPLKTLPGREPAARVALADAHASLDSEASATAPFLLTSAPTPATAVLPPAPLPSPTHSASSEGFSIGRQLGLGVSRIVIDPGHGGHDPGAKGKGVDEAELVLDVALRLEKLLQKVTGVEVILTRRTDDFVPLTERTTIANREGADLFLSIHANASVNEQAGGVETYFLNFANNLGAAAVAARENAASGQAMGALPDFVKAIALNNKLDESRDFASLVQHSLVERLRGSNKTVKNLGVRQAPFLVLIGASMPSVLSEISFVTNKQEAKLLKSNAYRQRIAEALFTAIRKYQTSLRNAPAVALH